MAASKRFVVLGLGSFGSALASRLSANGCRVTGVDSDREHVDSLKDVLYEAVIGDVTDRESLAQLNLKEADAVFISLGEDITRSILATLHARELGARNIIVKGVTSEHGKILRHLGVDRVVFPEIEVAEELADRTTWPNVLDFLPIDAEFNLVELAVPRSCSGQTLRETDLRRRYGVSVLGIKDVLTGKLEISPDPDYKLNEDQLMLVLGRRSELEKLRELK